MRANQKGQESRERGREPLREKGGETEIGSSVFQTLDS
jgi:hypothetical protein